MICARAARIGRVAAAACSDWPVPAGGTTSPGPQPIPRTGRPTAGHRRQNSALVHLFIDIIYLQCRSHGRLVHKDGGCRRSASGGRSAPWERASVASGDWREQRAREATTLTGSDTVSAEPTGERAHVARAWRRTDTGAKFGSDL